MIPTLNEIEQLHRKYAPSEAAFQLVYTHCQIVWAIARQLLERHPKLAIDRELVRAGCLLHDIGTYSLYIDGTFDKDLYITHGIRGYELMKAEGLEERLCRIASHHTGVGLTKDDIEHQGLPLPREDFMAETIEERLVMYADKFHSKTPKFNSYEAYARRVQTFGDGHLESFQVLRDEFGLPDLKLLSAEYGHRIHE